jgi:hypothetical protein
MSGIIPHLLGDVAVYPLTCRRQGLPVPNSRFGKQHLPVVKYSRLLLSISNPAAEMEHWKKNEVMSADCHPVEGNQFDGWMCLAM